jgi:hypothetical protein
LHHYQLISLTGAINSIAYNDMNQPTLVTYANGMRSCLTYHETRFWPMLAQRKKDGA